ncbi:CHAP domain-containing protein [Streptomyces sp. NPDC052727]|uniref:CHAP domain-containing protein n=1 Tax=Streptomyces sp. NPDC052727 TaxID=3154854 RepID=UPI0034418FA2
MSNQFQKIVGIARAEKGYHEGRSGGHWNNDQKYSDQVPGLEWSDRMAWCAVFVSWCAMKAGLAALYPRTASCAYGVDWSKKRKQFGYTPKIGAQAFFGKNGAQHTGLVVDFDDEWITTVEGNTNTNGSAEGDGVYERRHRRKDAWVYGYGYPAFKADAPKPPAQTAPVKPAPHQIVALAAGVKPGAHHK